MTDGTQDLALPPDVERELDGVAPCEIAVGVLTYNNATTVSAVAAVGRARPQPPLAPPSPALLHADARSRGGAPDPLPAAGPPPLPGPPTPAARPAPPPARPR